MHQENLVGKINGEAVTEQLKQLTKVFAAPEAGEFPVASTREQLEVLERPHTATEIWKEADGKLVAERLAELECKLAVERARLSPMPPIELTEEQAKAAGIPSALDLLGKHAWSLRCLTDDVRRLSKVLYGEQRANATLALRHLEDAHHRMVLAQVSNPNC